MSREPGAGHSTQGRGPAASRSVRLPAYGSRLFVGAIMLALWGCSGGGRTPLVIYSPHGRDLLTLLQKRFEQLHPDIAVHWLDMGSQEVYDRVRSERANPQADVWFGGPATIFARGAQDSLLQPFRPTWAGTVAPHERGPGDLYFASYETPAVIVYADQAMKPAEAPQTWDALLEPKWKGKIIIRDPLASGTMRAVWGLLIERGFKKSADTAVAFGYLKALDAQTKEYVLNGTLLDQKIVRQEALITIWDLPDILLNKREGMQLGYVFPRDGTPVIEDAIGIVKGAKHAAAAKLWEEWIGSTEAQLLATRDGYRLPARQDLPADSLPAWAQEVRRQMVTATDMDWDQLATHGADWMRYWDERVRARGNRP
ncbi:MAG TPA: extracellular solute-binding protein [Gemmatimonadales bacterium]|nr:extracellular solute-binding protein [Gemmatimonadales bacterium]